MDKVLWRQQNQLIWLKELHGCLLELKQSFVRFGVYMNARGFDIYDVGEDVQHVVSLRWNDEFAQDPHLAFEPDRNPNGNVAYNLIFQLNTLDSDISNADFEPVYVEEEQKLKEVCAHLGHLRMNIDSVQFVRNFGELVVDWTNDVFIPAVEDLIQEHESFINDKKNEFDQGPVPLSGDVVHLFRIVSGGISALSGFNETFRKEVARPGFGGIAPVKVKNDVSGVLFYFNSLKYDYIFRTMVFENVTDNVFELMAASTLFTEEFRQNSYGHSEYLKQRRALAYNSAVAFFELVLKEIKSYFSGTQELHKLTPNVHKWIIPHITSFMLSSSGPKEGVSGFLLPLDSSRKQAGER